MSAAADDALWERRCRHVFALLREARITAREDRLNLFRWIVCDPTISSTNDLGVRELELIADMLRTWQRQGELESQAREHAVAAM